MGGILTSGTDPMFGVACNVSADCYPIWSGYYTAATTDAEKAKRCCMHTKLSKNDNYDVALASAEVYGWPRVVYQYSQTCNMDYPSWLDSTNTVSGYKSVANYKSGS